MMKLIRNSVLSTRIVSTLVPTILPTLIFALIISIVFFLTLPASADTASAELGVPELIVQIISPVDGDELSIPGVFNVSVSGGTPPYYILFESDVSGRLISGPLIYGTSDVSGTSGMGRSTSYYSGRFTPYYSIYYLPYGNHRISATVMDSGGMTAGDFVSVVVRTEPALENETETGLSAFIISPANGTHYRTVHFKPNASGGNSPYKYAWTSDLDGYLGEGEFTREMSLGEHLITLDVVDRTALRASDTAQIVLRSPLAASILSPREGTYYGEINFSASVLGGMAPYEYEWVLDERRVLGHLKTILGELSPGNHTISLKVTDPNRASANDTVKIIVKPKLSVSIGSSAMPVNGILMNPVSLYADVSGGNPPYTYQWKSNLDGAIGNKNSFTRELSEGEHRITLDVTDDSLSYATDYVDIVAGSLAHSPYKSLITPIILLVLSGIFIKMLMKMKKSYDE